MRLCQNQCACAYNCIMMMMKVMHGMHHKWATINEPAVQLKLARHCLGESKAQRLLRVYGADLIPELTQVDTTVDTTLNRTATGMTDFSRHHSSLGNKVGGLGLRRLKISGQPSRTGSQTHSTPQASRLVNSHQHPHHRGTHSRQPTLAAALCLNAEFTVL